MNIENLKTLGHYLLSLPKGYDKFCMLVYCSSYAEPYEAAEMLTKCGTVACAAGHGPSAGIDPDENEGWGQYILGKFGVTYSSAFYGWCFYDAWETFDPGPQQAGKRILYLLKHGLPEGFEEEYDNGYGSTLDRDFTRFVEIYNKEV